MSPQAASITLTADQEADARNEIDVEREIAQTVQDMRNIGLHKDKSLLLEIALPDRQPVLSGLVNSPYKAPLYWAQYPDCREAAAKLLAEEGLWDLDVAAVYAETGYQHFLESDPLLMCINRNYTGGPIEFGQVNLEKLKEFIKVASIRTLCRLDGVFFTRLHDRSGFGRENPELVEEVGDMLSRRQDFVRKGMSQLPDDVRRILEPVIESAVERRRKAFHP